MAKKRGRGRRRQARKVLGRAQLESRAIVAEARAGGIVEAETESRRIRSAAQEDASRIVLDARARADEILTHARALADAEREAVHARAELHTEPTPGRTAARRGPMRWDARDRSTLLDRAVDATAPSSVATTPSAQTRLTQP